MDQLPFPTVLGTVIPTTFQYVSHAGGVVKGRAESEKVNSGKERQSAEKEHLLWLRSPQERRAVVAGTQGWGGSIEGRRERRLKRGRAPGPQRLY